MEEYFKKAEKLIDELGIKDSEDLDRRVWNCDESSIATAAASKVILARRGSKWVHETKGGSGREVITIMGCGSAAGERLLPMVLYKGKHLYSTWTLNGPPGALYSKSESGWMEKENFFFWFQKCFLPAVKDLLKTGPIVLLLDGLQSNQYCLSRTGKRNQCTPLLLAITHQSFPATTECGSIWAPEDSLEVNTEGLQSRHTRQ